MKCAHGPHKNEKLGKIFRIKFLAYNVAMFYLPKLHRLPNVNSAANLRDLRTMTGVNAKAYAHQHVKGNNKQLVQLTSPKHINPKQRQEKNPIIRSFLLWGKDAISTIGTKM